MKKNSCSKCEASFTFLSRIVLLIKGDSVCNHCASLNKRIRSGWLLSIYYFITGMLFLINLPFYNNNMIIACLLLFLYFAGIIFDLCNTNTKLLEPEVRNSFNEDKSN